MRSKSLALLRPSQWIGYRIMAYSAFAGALKGCLALLAGRTPDHAMAEGLILGVSVMLGIVVGTRLNLLFLSLLARYLRSIRERVNRANEMLEEHLDEHIPTGEVSRLYRGVSRVCMASAVVGTFYFPITVFRVAIEWAVGFPGWPTSVIFLLAGAAIMVFGMSTTLLLCYQLDRESKQLLTHLPKHVVNEKNVKPIPDGTEITVDMKIGEKLIGTLTGVHSPA